MSADNFLGIYQTRKGVFIGRGCWSECDKSDCEECPNTIIFTTKSLREAIQFAQDAYATGNYEYGYRFLNFKGGEEMTDLYDINTRNRTRKFRGTRGFGSICLTCGNRWGAHLDDDCPEDDTSIRQREQGDKGMEKYWVCWVAGTDGGRHYKHWTLPGAQIEAERLARLPDVQGKTVCLFECVGECKAEQTPIMWKVPR